VTGSAPAVVVALGVALLVVGAVLVLGAGGVRRPVRRRPSGRRTGMHAEGPTVDLLCDLVAACLAAGAPPGRALEVVGRAVGGPDGAVLVTAAAERDLGAGVDRAWRGVPARFTPLRDALRLGEEAGVPAVGLLHAAAGEARRRRHRHAEAEAQRLGVRLVLPLGAAALPAFAAWGVVPVVLALAQGTSVP
jgi:Flp pilus assembly protein TadB